MFYSAQALFGGNFFRYLSGVFVISKKNGEWSRSKKMEKGRKIVSMIGYIKQFLDEKNKIVSIAE